MEEVRADTWAVLLDHLYQGSWNPELGRHRLSVAFRGVPRSEYGLQTSLTRLVAGRGYELEAHVLRAFRKYAYAETRLADSAWNWLALAQHHGLPTRLLDWSYSPLVALHFATEDAAYMASDGLVWAVDFARTNEALPGPLRGVLDREGTPVFTAEMLESVAAGLHEFDTLSEQDFVAFFEPPSLDQRIVSQQALFSLASRPDLGLEDWLKAHPGACRRLVIPAELKWEVRDKLDQAGVNERVLFPGLDGIGRWLARYYRSRG